MTRSQLRKRNRSARKYKALRPDVLYVPKSEALIYIYLNFWSGEANVRRAADHPLPREASHGKTCVPFV
jgi:hypothetical protein